MLCSGNKLGKSIISAQKLHFIYAPNISDEHLTKKKDVSVWRLELDESLSNVNEVSKGHAAPLSCINKSGRTF